MDGCVGCIVVLVVLVDFTHNSIAKTFKIKSNAVSFKNKLV